MGKVAPPIQSPFVSGRPWRFCTSFMLAQSCLPPVLTAKEVNYCGDRFGLECLGFEFKVHARSSPCLNKRPNNCSEISLFISSLILYLSEYTLRLLNAISKNFAISAASYSR